jgi:hypothetical protein
LWEAREPSEVYKSCDIALFCALCQRGCQPSDRCSGVETIAIFLGANGEDVCTYIHGQVFWLIRMAAVGKRQDPMMKADEGIENDN